MSIYENVLEEEYENKVNSSENIYADIEEELPLVDSNNIELANSTNMMFF